MTKKLAAFFVLSMMMISVLACSPKESSDYFFVEIQANGERLEDIESANLAKEGVYAYLAALVNGCESLNAAEKKVNANLGNIKYIVNEILDTYQVNYDGKITVEKIKRDKCQIGSTVIEKGNYQTLIITLGEGKGKTSFSVVYPALTFVEGEQDIILKSKFYEIVKEKKSVWSGKTT